MLKLRLNKRRYLFFIVFFLLSLSTLFFLLLSSGKENYAFLENNKNISSTHTTVGNSSDVVINQHTSQSPSPLSATVSQDEFQDTTTISKKPYHANPSEYSVIVNKKNPINPINFVPPDLTSYNGYLLSTKLLSDLQSLLSASAENGTPIGLTSAYRSYSNQITTYNYWTAVNGGTSAADKISARPGFSEHQTGFAIDFSYGSCYLDCFNGSPQYTWLTKNAAKYGFIERYPKGYESITGYSPESWHWRYVGPKTALAMEMTGIKTLEELWGVDGGDY